MHTFRNLERPPYRLPPLRRASRAMARPTGAIPSVTCNVAAAISIFPRATLRPSSHSSHQLTTLCFHEPGNIGPSAQPSGENPTDEDPTAVTGGCHTVVHEDFDARAARTSFFRLPSHQGQQLIDGVPVSLLEAGESWRVGQAAHPVVPLFCRLNLDLAVNQHAGRDGADRVSHVGMQRNDSLRLQ